MNYKLYLRGAAQVMFQGNAMTGLLVMLGIFWGACECRQPIIGWAALAGLVVSTTVGVITDRKAADANAGLYGFNGVLVGCALATFLGGTWQMWAALVLCSAATVWLRNGMNKVLKQWGINSLTMPFVLLTWVMLLASREFSTMCHTTLSHPSLLPHTALPFPISVPDLLVAWLKGISQVFLANSAGAGIFFIVALACSSIAAAMWAMLGSAIALFTAIALGADAVDIATGMYGYSPVLTAIALGCTFYKPGIRSALWCIIGIITTVYVQAAMYALMLPYGIATLTAPFCITTWMFLLPRYALNDKKRPDHTNWHKNLTNS
jgi:urea transporter